MLFSNIFTSCPRQPSEKFSINNLFKQWGTRLSQTPLCITGLLGKTKCSNAHCTPDRSPIPLRDSVTDRFNKSQ